MHRASKLLIKAGIISAVIIYFAALMLLVLSDELFPDFNTCEIWFGQIAKLGKEMLAALCIPPLLGEIIMSAAGVHRG